MPDLLKNPLLQFEVHVVAYKTDPLTQLVQISLTWHEAHVLLQVKQLAVSISL
jgi:hypothetical protein